MNLKEKLQQLAQQREQLWIALHETNGAMKILELQILEAEPESSQPLNTTASNQESKQRHQSKGAANLIKISLSIMFQKICQIASLLSLFLTLSMLGGSYYAYRFVTSEQFKARVMNEVLDNVQGMMPKVLDNVMPNVTGPSMPLPKK